MTPDRKRLTEGGVVAVVAIPLEDHERLFDELVDLMEEEGYWSEDLIFELTSLDRVVQIGGAVRKETDHLGLPMPAHPGLLISLDTYGPTEPLSEQVTKIADRASSLVSDLEA